MTKANKDRLKYVAKRLNDAVKQNDDAKTATYIIHDSLRRLMVILEDLHFRPEVNSEDEP